MRLTELMQREQGKLSSFLDRTYWVAEWSKSRVFVYNSKSDRENPDKKPLKVMSFEEAHRHIETLFNDLPEPQRIREIKPQPKVRSELMKVTDMTVEGELISETWIDSHSGETTHRFEYGKAGGQHNGN